MGQNSSVQGWEVLELRGRWGRVGGEINGSADCLCVCMVHTVSGRSHAGRDRRGVKVVVLCNSLKGDICGQRKVPLLDVLPEVLNVLRGVGGWPHRAALTRQLLCQAWGKRPTQQLLRQARGMAPTGTARAPGLRQS